MPQIKVGETVNFTVGSYNSISRGPSQQAHGTWYYSIKGSFAGGDKLQGTAHLIWSMLECWPGAGGVIAITRTGPEDFSSSLVKGGTDNQPPKLEDTTRRQGASTWSLRWQRARLAPTRLTGPDQPSRSKHRLPGQLRRQHPL